MVIELYNTNSENNKLNKSLSMYKTLNGNLKDETSVMNPVILIESDSLPLANYLYIPSFKRYYFIDSIDIVRDKLFRIHANVDVLMSYKNEIKNISAIIEKVQDESHANKNIVDGTYTTTPEVFTEVLQFNSAFTNSPVFLLTCV